MPGWGGETQHIYKPWSSDPSSIWSPSFPLPYPTWEADPEGMLAPQGATGAGSCVPAGVGLLLPPHTGPPRARGKNKSTGKGGRQVLLSGSLVSMATGSALLQLLTPQSLCHPIFSWEIKEKGKVLAVWGGDSWETFLGFAERRLIRMQPCLAFNHKLNPLCGGFLWDCSDLMHSQIPHLPPPWSSVQGRQLSHPLRSMRSSQAANFT